RSHWPLLVLCLAFIAIMVAARRLGLGQSVHGVARQSKGEIYYVVATYLLFLVGHRQPVLYSIALFALVVSVALAALLGQTYGRWTYAVEGGRKTWEGTAVFFLVTFLGVHLPLLLLTHLDRGHCVLIGIQVGLIVAAFEAISLGGNDNLIVP